MITLQQHLDNNREAIEKEAEVYAKAFSCSLKVAIRDVSEEYTQGWHEGNEAARNGDWDLYQE